MRVVGLGIDVVEIRRIAAAIERHGGAIARRLFTAAELEYCRGKTNPAMHYAARFAAKEAVAKAMGCGIGGSAAWLDLEVCRNESGAPVILLHGAARRFADARGITEIQISLTHTREYAAANAIALARN